MAGIQIKKNKKSRDDRCFDLIANGLLILLVIVVAYPIWFVVVASFSDPMYVNNGTPLLYPRGFTLKGYENVFRNERIWTGYANTIFYTVSGTVLGTIATIMAGYSLSRRDLPGRKILMRLCVFTMYFSGGMIPYYLVIKGLGLVNNRLVLVLAGSVSAYNVIVTRSFMESNIPDELLEAATIDGCSNAKFFGRIVVPLSKAVIAVIVLYLAVGYWNSYFSAMIFMTDAEKYPLQLVLRQILLQASAASSAATLSTDPEAAMQLENLVMIIKYAVIVVSTAPIICVYPFIQKYFVKGVMIGSVKG